MTWELTIRHDHHLPHPAERVWDAVATGRGNRGWLYPVEIEPRVGGAVARGSGGTVQEWAPPHRLAIRIADGTGFSSNLAYDVDDDGHLDVTIRWIHENEQAPDSEWRRKADAAQAHAEFYHHGLREYLDHFADRDAVYVSAVPDEGAPHPPIPVMLGRLGVPQEAAAGDTVRFAPPHGPAGDAVVVHRDEALTLLRSTGGLHRFFDGDPRGWFTWTAHHLFGDGVDEQAAARAWKGWFAGG